VARNRRPALDGKLACQDLVWKGSRSWSPTYYEIKPFRAHVTLVRKVPRGTYDRALQPVLWSFTDFALVGSRPGPDGSSYSILNSWPLCTEVRKMPEKKHK
jgi:hypothetical protein